MDARFPLIPVLEQTDLAVPHLSADLHDLPIEIEVSPIEADDLARSVVRGWLALPEPALMLELEADVCMFWRGASVAALGRRVARMRLAIVCFLLLGACDYCISDTEVRGIVADQNGTTLSAASVHACWWYDLPDDGCRTSVTADTFKILARQGTSGDRCALYNLRIEHPGCTTKEVGGLSVPRHQSRDLDVGKLPLSCS